MIKFIDYKLMEGVAVVTLNRPDVLNSFNYQMAKELQDILDDCQLDNNIRAILITGSGRAFSAGQDLQDALSGDFTVSEIVNKYYNPIILKIRNLHKPVIAAVNGVAAGAGANIALSCDIVLASEKASFIQAFSKIGLVPDSGGTYFLPRLIGFQKASALMMLGDKVSANDAEKLGLVYKIFNENELYENALQLALEVSQMPTKALAYTKQLLNESFNNSLEKQLKLEEELQDKAGKSNDYKEGVNAFLEKRKPEFKGE